jgi:hypothetical protein
MISTGIKGLDNVITGLCKGDNVVWQIDTLSDYRAFIKPFVKEALKEKRRVVYIRFAHHAPLFEKSKDIVVYALDASAGFESFSAQLHEIITQEGRGVFYVFDCLSDLLIAWSNDLMIGNFFKITCPYLFELDTIAYFSLLRNRHSFKTVARVRDTTQLLIDVYNDGGNCYIHPLKVWNRYSPTMFLPHAKEKDRFVPIANSIDAARLFSHFFKKGSKSASRKLDYWDKLFISAEEIAAKKPVAREKKEQMLEQLLKMVIARDEKMFNLAKRYLTLEDFLTIKSRMIGTGFIGGKSAGMVIARAIAAREKSLEAEKIFEPHDSFYIGADVFYTYIVDNGWWKMRMAQRTKEGYREAARVLKEKLLHGAFPEEIKEQFQQMIEYFGQSPIIVRSSSLLEDSYGNAFAGKYESIFLANQGAPEQRYAQFVEAVRRIYASTMSDDALAYRLQRGLDQLDEQMALLVQRVSGSYRGRYFFPDISGVGISYNTFVWKMNMDPKAGMARIVLGLGTRAVNRLEGDYARIVALDEPLLKAHTGMEDTRQFSQHDVDALDIRDNTLVTVPLRRLQAQHVPMRLDMAATKDERATEKLREMNIDEEHMVLTFDPLCSSTRFPQVIQKILKTLEKAYDYPVDIEFTVNFKKDDRFQVNLLQCRPVQTKGLGRRAEIPGDIPRENIIFHSTGNFLGGNVSQEIKKLIYVDPKAYDALVMQSAKYDVARAVGELNRSFGETDGAGIMLLGPGRWGTTTPSLGVPVSFAEINHISVLGEIAFKGNSVIPELSFGTHFFQDLIETGIFYIALFPERVEDFFNQDFFDALPLTLKQYLPHYGHYEHVIKVAEFTQRPAKIVSDIVSQKVLCYFSQGS